VALAEAVGERTSTPVARVLARVDERQQSRLSRADRLASGQARRVTVVGAVPASCVLVDDVHTTGATLHACALALREGGAERVVAVTATRTLNGR
jgi:predicted amidophosphoribosyltransferase